MQSFSKMLKSFAAFSVAVILISSSSVTGGAASVSGLKGQQSALKICREENQKKLDELKNDSKNRSKYIETLKAQLIVIDEENDLLEQQLTAIEEQKTSSAKSFADKLKAAGGDFSELSANILKLSASGSPEELINALLDTQIVQYIVFLSCSTETVASANDLSDTASQLKALAITQQTLEKKIAENADAEQSVTNSLTEAQTAQEIDTENEDSVQSDNDDIDDQLDANTNAVDNWYNEYRQKQLEVNGDKVNNLGGATVAGTAQFIWPMPGFTMISCYYGEDGHRGIDITGNGINGKSIVAADSGTVAFAGEMDSYGNVVFIDHGNGYITCYAHMLSIGVREGDTVMQGAVIGLVGSTGNSSGPHLHFEVRYDGENTNPFDYF